MVAFLHHALVKPGIGAGNGEKFSASHTRQLMKADKSKKAQRFYFRCAFALPYNYLIPKFLRYCSFIRLKLSSLISCSILHES